MPSICPHVHRQFLRNELHDFTTIVPVTVYHQGSYVETYSKFKHSKACATAQGRRSVMRPMSWSTASAK
jgi:hypothetical protein